MKQFHQSQICGKFSASKKRNKMGMESKWKILPRNLKLSHNRNCQLIQKCKQLHDQAHEQYQSLKRETFSV